MTGQEMSVSLIIVVRNERKYIEKAVESLINQTYPKSLTEYVFVDGMSTDGTREYLSHVAKELSENGCKVKIASNRKMILASGWNIALDLSGGEYVCRIDAHSEIAPDYVKIGIEELKRREGEKIAAVGGWLVSEAGGGVVPRAASALFSSRFGIGNSPFRARPKGIVESDTAVYGIYKRSLLRLYGGFDESLDRNQDVALHKLLWSDGYRFVTHPGMRVLYRVRSTLRGVVNKAFRDGYWVRYSGASYLRHRVPLVFVLYICALFIVWMAGLVGVNIPIWVYWSSAVPAMLYVAIAMYCSLNKLGVANPLVLFLMYFVYHAAYGVGSIMAIVRHIRERGFNS